MYSTWCRCWFHSRFIILNLNSLQVSLQVNVIQKLPPSFPLADWIFPPGTAPMRNSMANACKAPMAAAASVGSTPSVSRCGSPPYARQNCKTSATSRRQAEKPQNLSQVKVGADVRFLLEKMGKLRIWNCQRYFLLCKEHQNDPRKRHYSGGLFWEKGNVEFLAKWKMGWANTHNVCWIPRFLLFLHLVYTAGVGRTNKTLQEPN